ncbi:hypothetical protein BASA50_010336 [Batrachochytrium salamandrivorans]|uniref:BAR domain-containing protein n=1 Tax=Batrachochytrium salamandrivorans TaxID=1357716 RepID=A0ABQ8F1N2_9FUNG|nr:hypothetical protein BASA50_010336 [Batrachochytrium salamandrivorans]
MRVGVGVILSVLSSSALAAVIPNYDSHGILLVRRTGSLENKDVSWSKAMGINAEASTRGRGVSSRLGRSFSNIKTRWGIAKQRATLKLDERYLQNAIEALTEVTEGETKDQLISEIETLLRTIQKSAKGFMKEFKNKAQTPFVLTIPEGKNKRSLTREMTKIQKTAKKSIENYLKHVQYGLADINKRPQTVMKEMRKIVNDMSYMYLEFKGLYANKYMALVSKVKHTNNKKHIGDTEKYLSDINENRGPTLESFNAIKNHVRVGKITFKEKTQSKKSRAKRRLGSKGKSPTDVTPGQEESKQEPSDGDTSGQGPSDEKPSNQGPPDQEESDQANQIRSQQDRYHHHGSQNLIDKNLMFSTVDLCRPYLLYRSIQTSIFTILIPSYYVVLEFESHRYSGVHVCLCLVLFPPHSCVPLSLSLLVFDV